MTQRERCRNGDHPWTDENIYVDCRGQKNCRPCMNAVKRRYYASKRSDRFCECGRKLNGQKRACAPCRSQRSSSYNITDGDRAWTYDRDGHQCLKCESTDDLTVDHVLPRALGGADHRSNYQTLCTACNSSKGATYADYRHGSTGQLSLVLTPPKQTLRSRFMDKVEIGQDGCWLWTGALMNGITPAISVDGRAATAAQVSWLLHHGEEATSRLRRSCKNTLCVAPGHLVGRKTQALAS